MPARMSGEIIEGAAQPAWARHDRPVRVAEHDAGGPSRSACRRRTSAISNIFFEHQDDAVALARGDDRKSTSGRRGNAGHG